MEATLEQTEEDMRYEEAEMADVKESLWTE